MRNEPRLRVAYEDVTDNPDEIGTVPAAELVLVVRVGKPKKRGRGGRENVRSVR